MDPLLSLCCQPARQFPEGKSASQFKVEELRLRVRGDHYLCLAIPKITPLLKGYVTQLHFQIFKGIYLFLPLRACKLIWLGGGGRLQSVIPSACVRHILAAFDLAHCLRIILPPTPLNPSPSPLSPLEAEISGVGEARVVGRHIVQPQWRLIFKSLISRGLKELCCWSLYMPGSAGSLMYAILVL